MLATKVTKSHPKLLKTHLYRTKTHPYRTKDDQSHTILTQSHQYGINLTQSQLKQIKGDYTQPKLIHIEEKTPKDIQNSSKVIRKLPIANQRRSNPHKNSPIPNKNSSILNQKRPKSLILIQYTPNVINIHPKLAYTEPKLIHTE